MTFFGRWNENDDLTEEEKILGLVNCIENLRERLRITNNEKEILETRVKGLIEIRNNQRYEINRLNCKLEK